MESNNSRPWIFVVETMMTMFLTLTLSSKLVWETSMHGRCHELELASVARSSMPTQWRPISTFGWTKMLTALSWFDLSGASHPFASWICKRTTGRSLFLPAVIAVPDTPGTYSYDPLLPLVGAKSIVPSPMNSVLLRHSSPNLAKGLNEQGDTDTGFSR